MHRNRRLTVEKMELLAANRLRSAVHGAEVPLTVTARHLRGEPVPYDEAVAGEFAPFSIGDAWGGAWDTTWFNLTGSIPAAWRGNEVVVRIDLGSPGDVGFTGEGLLWVDGEPRQGIHRRHGDFHLASPATGGETVDLYLEAAANPPIPGGDFRSRDWPLQLPDVEGPPLFRLQRAHLAVFNRPVWDYLNDFRVCLDLLRALPADDPRGVALLDALERSCRDLAYDDVAGTVERAREPLRHALSETAAGGHTVTAVGHAHIDTAWLWPVRETRRKCARTFATATLLMEEYPEYVFLASQAQHYAWIKEAYPALFERIRARVAEGRFEPVGGMWVEADTNVPSGESLVRQFVLGKRFFAEELGVETKEVWLPDAFGFCAQLPQIAREAGCEYFLTQKLSWNDTNAFPHHTFWWEGLDGSRLFAHFPPSHTYGGSFRAQQLVEGARRFTEHGRSDRSLYLYGYGDGGGGPNRDMLEGARRLADVAGAPRVELGPARDFFRRAAEEANDLPVWVGEHYFECHRGTYTTQAKVKGGNRRGEVLLHDAELWGAVAALRGFDYPATELDAAWRMLLLHQFHDVLPGTSIRWVNEEAGRDHDEVHRVAGAVAEAATAHLAAAVDTSGAARPLLVFNSTSHDRRELLVLPASAAGEARSVRLPGGEVRPVQRLADGTVALPVVVPACGYALHDLSDAPAPGAAGVAVDARTLENDLLRVEWDGNGLLRSIFDKEAGREVLAPGARGNLFQLHDDYPNVFDAWDVDRAYRDRVDDLVAVERIEVVDEGPLRASVRFVRLFGASRISQTMSLDAGSRVLLFDTEVDWNESHRFLKVGFPVNVRSHRATYEVQFGHVERTTHENTPYDAAQFEVWAHRWADLGEAGYGVALLNDSKYGYDIHGNVMRLSLLRAPTAPDPLADRGTHRFRYALLPHPRDFREAGVIDAGYDLNVPLRVHAVAPHAGDLPPSASFFSTDVPNVVVDTVKRADDGDGIVVRLYEAWGGRGGVRMRAGALGVRSATTADVLERDREPVPVGEDGDVAISATPFKIITLRLR